MSSPTALAPFVGRATEMARLNQFLEEATTGAGHTCFVTGEPGAGKTSLLDEFIRLARERHPDLVIAEGDCNPQTGTGDAYLPFREIMTQLSAGQPSDSAQSGKVEKSSGFLGFAGRLVIEHGPDLIDLFVPGAALLTRVSGEAADRLRKRRGAAGQADAGASVTIGSLGQSQIMEQYTNVILAMSERQPLMLVLDDLHWADESSVNLLFHLSRRIPGHRVLLAGAFRASEVAAGRGDARHPLEAPLNELKRYQGDIEVQLPVGQAEPCREFVDQLLDAEPNMLDEAFRSELYRRTGGHALFTVELLHHLRQQGSIRRNDDGAWYPTDDLSWDVLPARVEGVIREKAARLDRAEFDLMAAASVLGESFDAEVLAMVVDRKPREVARDLSGSLGRQHALVQACGVHYVGGQRLSEYEFRHNLVHEYFYNALDEVERSFLHEAAAVAIEEQFGADCADVAVYLGRHFSLAEIPDRAAHYLLMAGNEARRSFANRESRVHLEHALEMVEKAEALKARDHDWISRTRQSALGQLGEVMIMQGDFEGARHCFECALELQESNDLERVRLLTRIAVSFEREHRHEDALEVLDGALHTLDSPGVTDEHEGRSAWMTIQVQKLWLYYWRGNIEGMEKTIGQAETVIEEHGDSAQQQRFYGGKAALGNRHDRFLPGFDTVKTAEQALAVSLASDNIHHQIEGRFDSAFIFMLADDFERARMQMEEVLELTVKCGNRTLEARVLTYLAVLFRRLGEPERVADYVERASAVAVELGMHEYVAAALACRSWTAWLDGDAESALALGNEALDEWQAHAPRYPFKWLALVQMLDIALGDADEKAALKRAQFLLEPGNARLGSGVSETLEAAVAANDEGKHEIAQAQLREATAKARTAGYL